MIPADPTGALAFASTKAESPRRRRRRSRWTTPRASSTTSRRRRGRQGDREGRDRRQGRQVHLHRRPLARDLRVPLHRPGPCGRRHEGHPDRQVAPGGSSGPAWPKPSTLLPLAPASARPARRARRPAGPRRPARRQLAHGAAGLGHEQAPGGPVPALQAALVVAVEAAGGDQARSSAAAPGAADVAHAREHPPKHLGLRGAPLARRSRSRWRPARARAAPAARTRIGRAVQRGAAAARGAEGLAARGSWTTPDERAVGVLERDADRPRADSGRGSWWCRRAGRPPSAGRCAPRSPRPPRRAGRRRAARRAAVRAISASASRSASETMSVVEDFALEPLGRVAEALEQQLARRAGGPLGELEVRRSERPRDQDDGDDRGDDDRDVEQEAERLLLGAERVEHGARGCRSLQ